jgi:hypothetical protein
MTQEERSSIPIRVENSLLAQKQGAFATEQQIESIAYFALKMGN